MCTVQILYSCALCKGFIQMIQDTKLSQKYFCSTSGNVNHQVANNVISVCSCKQKWSLGLFPIFHMNPVMGDGAV